MLRNHVRPVWWGRGLPDPSPCPLASPSLGCLLQLSLGGLGFIRGHPDIQCAPLSQGPPPGRGGLGSPPPRGPTRHTLPVTRVNTPKQPESSTAYSAFSTAGLRLGCREAGVLPERTGSQARVGGWCLEVPSDCSLMRPYQSFCPQAGQFQPLSHPAPIPVGRAWAPAISRVLPRGQEDQGPVWRLP